MNLSSSYIPSYSQQLLIKYHGVPVFSPLCKNNNNNNNNEQQQQQQQQQQQRVQSTYDKTSKHCSLVIPPVYGNYNQKFDDTLYGLSYHDIIKSKMEWIIEINHRE